MNLIILISDLLSSGILSSMGALHHLKLFNQQFFTYFVELIKTKPPCLFFTKKITPWPFFFFFSLGLLVRFLLKFSIFTQMNKMFL